MSEVWAATLAQLPGLFERLIYLAKLRDPATGEYHHHGLATRFSPAEAHAAILHSHEATFASWLAKAVEEQLSDIELYLSRNSLDSQAVVRHWMEVSPAADILPASARDSERSLFVSDFKALLAILTVRLRVTRRDPEDR